MLSQIPTDNDSNLRKDLEEILSLQTFIAPEVPNLNCFSSVGLVLTRHFPNRETVAGWQKVVVDIFEDKIDYRDYLNH